MELHYEERRPRRELSPYLECLWMASDPGPRPRRPPERVVPDGCPELILHLADPFARKTGRRWVVQPLAFLAGTLTRPWLLRGGLRVQTLGVRFRPAAVTAVLPLSMAAACDRELPLPEIVGEAAARALVDAVSRPNSLRRRFDAAEAWLEGQLARAPVTRSSARRAAALILRARGQVRIRDLARAVGYGPRRLERAFEHDLGIPPKLFARIVRLNAVLERLDAAERSKAVDLALDAGYFDQAHLLKDFRSLAGKTPRASRDADGRLARHFTSADRLRALLDGA